MPSAWSLLFYPNRLHSISYKCCSQLCLAVFFSSRGSQIPTCIRTTLLDCWAQPQGFWAIMCGVRPRNLHFLPIYRWHCFCWSGNHCHREFLQGDKQQKLIEFTVQALPLLWGFSIDYSKLFSTLKGELGPVPKLLLREIRNDSSFHWLLSL